ncbi:hypothetical protein F2Q70_00003399 [Brassica cretica]|uniref:No apical meristem-associated C-terminal domain-containing protein n=1 Tax=Brassica cretica TaxID=69181 RepID=A0A8S9IUX0_BRACR|nr:hypothetical protein F2Q70_00003399 [Brassica cretica]
MTSPNLGLEGTLFRGYVAQSDWVEERSVLFLLSFSLSVFRFSSLGGETANPRHLDDSLTKRRSLFRWLSARPLSVALGEASFGSSRRGRKTTHCLSVAPLQQGKRRHISLYREASVAEDYEAGGGLVDDEDYDGWVATHVNPSLCSAQLDKALNQVGLTRGEASVAEDYEAGGGLVDDEDYDGWVATHVRSKGCLMKMVLRLFDHVLRNDQKWREALSAKNEGSSKKRKCEDGGDSSSSQANDMKWPPGVKASKARGKQTMGEENAMKEFETMSSIRQQDLGIKERLSKMRLLDSLIAKKEPLVEYEEALKKKLINELLLF